jgi:hypothetical protein
MTIPQYPHLLPVFEHERLEGLRPYRVLGTPGQPLFNDFVSIVGKLFDVPIAVLTLVREADVLLVGSHGLAGAARAADAEDLLCSVAVRQNSLTVFESLAAEATLLINPFVARQLELHFYAAQCLRSPEGVPVGTLALMDSAPRELAPAEAALLVRLALVAQDLLLLQPSEATNAALAPALRARLDGPLHRSLTRIETLTQLGEWEGRLDAAEALPYTIARLHEADHLAFVLHHELLGALAEAG